MTSIIAIKNDTIIYESISDYDFIFMNETEVFNNESSSNCNNEMDISVINFNELRYPRPELISNNISLKEYLEILICVIVIIVILIGNGGVIIAVALNRSLRSTINYYLTNLAVSALLICAFCLWVNQIAIITKPFYILGPFMCKFNAFTQMSCLTSSVLTLSAISCDRFVAILYPLRARVTKQRTGLVITIIWFISIGVSIPFLLYRKHHVIQWRDFTETRCFETWPTPRHFDKERGQCITLNTIKQLYYTIVTIMLFFIPVLVMVSAYSMIIRKLWIRVLPGEMANKNGYLVQMNAKKKVIKMVFLVLIIFVISWMPLQIIVLYSQFGHSSHDSGELPKWFSSLSYISHFIAYGSSATNPIIYGGFNKNFRDSLYSLIRCKFYLINRPNFQKFETHLTTTRTNHSPNNLPKTAFEEI